MSTPLEDYALIGDCEIAALLSRGGSIDGLCWRRLDSAACFAALLGGPEHGRWLLAVVDPAQVARRYREHADPRNAVRELTTVGEFEVQADKTGTKARKHEKEN